jgi:hypothetical protein
MSPTETMPEKPTPRRAGPFQEAGRDRPRLRDQREIAFPRHPHREAGIELHARNQQAKAIGPDQPHAVRMRGKPRGLGRRIRPVPHAGCDDHRRSATHGAERGDRVHDRRRRRGDDRQVRDRCQVLDALDRGHSFDLAMARIHQMETALKSAGADISQDHPADRFLARTCADERDRAGSKQAVEAIRAHGRSRGLCPERAPASG